MWSYPSNSNIQYLETRNQIHYLQEFGIQIPQQPNPSQSPKIKGQITTQILENRRPRSKSGKSQSLVGGLPLHAYIMQVTTTYYGNATLALFRLLLFLHSLYNKHWLRYRSGPAGSPPVSSILFFLFTVQAKSHSEYSISCPIVVPRHQSETVYQQKSIKIHTQ